MTKKILIAYYSWSGNTEKMAQKINEEISNSDLVQIKVSPETFSSDMNETSEIAEKQIKSNEFPEIIIPEIDFSQYDLVLVGTPMWGWKTCNTNLYFFDKVK